MGKNLPALGDEATTKGKMDVPEDKERAVDNIPGQDQDEESPVRPDIHSEVTQYVTSIDALLNTIGPTMLNLQGGERNATKRFRAYAQKYGEIIEEDKRSFSCRFHPPYDVTAGRLRKKIQKAETAAELVPRVYVLALVSQFDAFLGRLLRALFLLRPELIVNSERSLTLSQILEAGTIEAAIDLILDKELESVLRRSRMEQFDWMENRFGVKLRNDLPAWQTFIEVTERRNLFAHTNGVVSDQYLTVCKANHVELAKGCEKGTVLEVSPDYFKRAHACHFEIGLKLSQVLWRKLCPDDVENADSAFIEQTLDLIVDNRLDLACKLLDFALSKAMKHSSQENRLILTINRAQAYKWSGEDEKCKEIVEAEDWSACEPKYDLALAVLLDDFGKAATLMKVIGPNGSVVKQAYQDWPLFREFRKTDEFMTSYQDVFKESFVHIEQLLQGDEEQRRKDALKNLKEFLEREARDESEIPEDESV